MIIPAAPCLKARMTVSIANSPMARLASHTKAKYSTANDPNLWEYRLANAVRAVGAQAGDHARSKRSRLLFFMEVSHSFCELQGFFSIVGSSKGSVRGVGTALSPLAT